MITVQNLAIIQYNTLIFSKNNIKLIRKKSENRHKNPVNVVKYDVFCKQYANRMQTDVSD